MAKETLILFIYDVEHCKKEEDDPAEAILYFHPGWVSDQQRTSLCGQIMGSFHCLKSIFSCPSVLALQTGKFCIREFGRYVMAVGTDRNIPDWLLEQRAKMFTSLIRFLYYDIEKIAEQVQNRIKLSEKLYYMFETYLRILVYGGNVFSNIFTLHLPKSAGHIFLEAMQILQNCQNQNGVLGGAVLYHNKVVATQLSADLTKQLVLTDSYRIKSPAETVVPDFQLPLGVQLLYVYIRSSECQALCQEASRSQSTVLNLNKNHKKLTHSKSFTKEPVLSMMKRDQSLIFTTVLEEDSEHHITKKKLETENEPIPLKIFERPKTLDLKVKTTDFRCIKEVKKVASVCSTPVVDSVLHNNFFSICNNLDKYNVDFESEDKLNVRNESTDKFYKKKTVTEYILKPKNMLDMKLYSSMWELRENLVPVSKRPTMKYYTTDLTKHDESSDVSTKGSYMIADPVYPIFRSDGICVSKYLYDVYVKESCDAFTSYLAKDADAELENNVIVLDSDNEKAYFKEQKAEFIEDSKPIVTNTNTKESRKSLSLPLKSLASEQNADLFSPVGRNRGGVQLTPLMSKLSLLAFSEKSSGFCSRDTTPSEYKEFNSIPNDNLTRRNSLKRADSVIDEGGGDMEKAILYVCGQQDMVLLLILQQQAGDNKELIKKLWEISVDNLGKFESQLRHCLDIYPVATTESAEAYSYISIDSQWDTVQRGGPWGVPELQAVSQMHKDFAKYKNITEISIRNEDGVIYGYRCGPSEVFYQQSTVSSAGLPPPADLMGTVPLKARRKLEHDHSIILL